MNELLDTAPLLAIGIGMAIGMIALAEAGALLHGRYGRVGKGAAGTTDEGYILSGVFGLLALLLAFSLSLSLDRHEQRRELVVAEANAASTFANRLALLPPEREAAIRRELAVYLRLRIAAGSSQSFQDYLRHAGQGEARHAAMGGLLYGALGRGGQDTRAVLLLQPYNEMGDVAAARQASRAARLPGEVMLMLVLYCFAGAATLGYTLAGAGNRHRLASGVFFCLLALALAVIIDLDRPRDGFIRVSQKPLREVLAPLAPLPAGL